MIITLANIGHYKKKEMADRYNYPEVCLTFDAFRNQYQCLTNEKYLV